MCIDYLSLFSLHRNLFEDFLADFAEFCRVNNKALDDRR